MCEEPDRNEQQECREFVIFLPLIRKCNRQPKTAAALKFLPPATQIMGPSRKPGQDCQGEQVSASVMR
jgi:hypothetical protein